MFNININMKQASYKVLKTHFVLHNIPMTNQYNMQTTDKKLWLISGSLTSSGADTRWYLVEWDGVMLKGNPELYLFLFWN